MDTVRTISRSGLVRLQRWMRRHGWSYRGLINGSELGRECNNECMEYWTHDRDAVGAVLPVLNARVDEYPLYATDLSQIACAWVETRSVGTTLDDREVQRLIERAGNQVLESVEPSQTSRSCWYAGMRFATIRRHIEHLQRHPQDRKALERLRRLAREDYHLPRWGEREERRPERARRDALRRKAWEHPHTRNIERAGANHSHLRIETSYTMPDGHGVDLWLRFGQWEVLCDFYATTTALWVARGGRHDLMLRAAIQAARDIDGVTLDGGGTLFTDVGDDLDTAITRLGEACERVARALWEDDA